MELFKLFGTIAINNDGANREIAETTEAAEKSGSKLSAAFSKVGTAAVKVGKTVATGLAAGGAAVGALAKQSLDAYGDYEQLVGGVETLFNKAGKSWYDYAADLRAAGKMTAENADEQYEAYLKLAEGSIMVQENAAKAFRTAGLSANEYMETVTSFSASLLQSLGGDTAKAAEVADRAITDMADNANKMGTDISMIQNAYQGFAKQNYTMLDNLKLGYGGTKEEMKRLLEDAGKLANQKFDLSSYADIIEAIHVVQEEMGIAGATAEEAASTIQGSLGMTKAAWKNMMVAFADDGDIDFNAVMQNLVDSALIAFNNIMPRIETILHGITYAIETFMPILAAELPGILEQLLPGLISGAVALLNGLVAALPSILQILIEQLPFIFTQISAGLVQAFPMLLETVKNLFGQIFNYISLELLNTGISFETATAKIQEVMTKAWEVCQDVWNTIGQPIFDMVQNVIVSVRNAFSEKMPEIMEFVSQCFSDIKTFWENNLKPCLEAIGNFIKNVLAPAFQFVFNEFIVDAIDTAFQFIKDLWNNTLKPVFTGITDFLTGVFTGKWKQAFQGIINITKGIFSGLQNVVKAPINQVINLVNSFIKGLNKLKIPDWVPAVGGKGINIPLIPKLEKGGVLKKGQMGFLEGNGAEAVVPLDQNRAWISAVARDMNAETGADNGKLQQIIDMLSDFFPQFVEASGHDIVTNDGVIVAHYAPKLNLELGKISSRKDRGR